MPTPAPARAPSAARKPASPSSPPRGAARPAARKPRPAAMAPAEGGQPAPPANGADSPGEAAYGDAREEPIEDVRDVGVAEGEGEEMPEDVEGEAPEENGGFDEGAPEDYAEDYPEEDYPEEDYPEEEDAEDGDGGAEVEVAEQDLVEFSTDEEPPAGDGDPAFGEEQLDDGDGYDDEPYLEDEEAYPEAVAQPVMVRQPAPPPQRQPARQLAPAQQQRTLQRHPNDSGSSETDEEEVPAGRAAYARVPAHSVPPSRDASPPARARQAPQQVQTRQQAPAAQAVRLQQRPVAVQHQARVAPPQARPPQAQQRQSPVQQTPIQHVAAQQPRRPTSQPIQRPAAPPAAQHAHAQRPQSASPARSPQAASRPPTARPPPSHPTPRPTPPPKVLPAPPSEDPKLRAELTALQATLANLTQQLLEQKKAAATAETSSRHRADAAAAGFNQTIEVLRRQLETFKREYEGEKAKRQSAERAQAEVKHQLADAVKRGDLLQGDLDALIRDSGDNLRLFQAREKELRNALSESDGRAREAEKRWRDSDAEAERERQQVKFLAEEIAKLSGSPLNPAHLRGAASPGGPPAPPSADVSALHRRIADQDLVISAMRDKITKDGDWIRKLEAEVSTYRARKQPSGLSAILGALSPQDPDDRLRASENELLRTRVELGSAMKERDALAQKLRQAQQDNRELGARCEELKGQLATYANWVQQAREAQHRGLVAGVAGGFSSMGSGAGAPLAGGFAGVGAGAAAPVQAGYFSHPARPPAEQAAAPGAGYFSHPQTPPKDKVPLPRAPLSRGGSQGRLRSQSPAWTAGPGMAREGMVWAEGAGGEQAPAGEEAVGEAAGGEGGEAKEVGGGEEKVEAGEEKAEGSPIRDGAEGDHAVTPLEAVPDHGDKRSEKGTPVDEGKPADEQEGPSPAKPAADEPAPADVEQGPAHPATPLLPADSLDTVGDAAVGEDPAPEPGPPENDNVFAGLGDPEGEAEDGEKQEKVANLVRMMSFNG
ncbi:hypothetical protein DFJ74DRAFT_647857 [Hyaloraphidium curvatum]|nr:hypothetical protein DFJ74DRAFT_647857 [Hyaloraphidium curvatum]